MANGSLDVLLRELAEQPRALLIEAEVDDGLVVLLVEARLGVDEILAVHDGDFFQKVARGAAPLTLLARLEDLVPRRRTSFRSIGRGDRVVHLMERQLCGLAHEFLQLFRIFEAWKLNEDAVLALADNRGFSGAQRVDAPVDGLDRRRDRVLHALVDALLRRLDGDDARLGRLLDVDVIAAGAENDVADGLDEFLQLGQRLVGVLGLVETDLHRAATGTKPRHADLGIAHRLTRIVLEMCEPTRLQFGRIHLEQEMRAAAEIQPQRHLPLRQPIRPRRQLVLGGEVGRGEQHAEQHGAQNGEDLPAFEMQHVKPATLLSRV